jgi:glycosyltransferase involved in cell wall biosynthesis
MVASDRVRFVTYRQEHHSPHSGYDALTNYFGTAISAEPLPKQIVRNRLMYFIADGTPAYDRQAFAAEIKAARRLLTDKCCIYHVLYGENTYHYFGWFNNHRKNRIIATYHLPPSVFRDAVRIDWHIRKLSAVICVAQNQIDMFAPLLGRDRVFFVPHGIDAEFFTPPANFERREPNLCLFVGTFLRDFPTLRGVVELVAYRRPDVRFVVVTGSASIDRVGVHPNMSVRTHIPESELVHLYQTATLMVMPLLDATGNNALLEGMSCGLPTVVSDVVGVRDYVDPESAVLVPPRDARRLAEEVLALLGDSEQLKRKSELARKRALQFAWPEVVKQLRAVYDRIL